MPRPRNPENKSLPKRWKIQHGAYYYQVPPGLESAWDGRKLFRLGKSLHEAYKAWADRLQGTIEVRTIGTLLDRYALEVIPGKAISTQRGNTLSLQWLRPVFGHMPLSGFRPRYIYQYVDKRKGKVSAQRDVEVLSHAFTKAVEWGYLDRHPFKAEVRFKNNKPRTRYVEDWEVVEMLSLDSRRKRGSVRAIQACIRLELLTGLRRKDLLQLKPAQHFKDDGIHITTSKTGKRVIYAWTPDLRAAVDGALAARPVDISPWLFCNKVGEGYIDQATDDPRGWKSMWGRFVTRVMAETKITERFTAHDLRAKVGSDAESLERARALLAHADSRITQRVYRRKPERVQPVS